MGELRHKITYVPKKKYPPKNTSSEGSPSSLLSSKPPTKVSHHAKSASVSHKKLPVAKKAVPESTKKTVKPPPPPPPPSSSTSVASSVQGTAEGSGEVVKKPSKKKKKAPLRVDSEPTSAVDRSEKEHPSLDHTHGVAPSLNGKAGSGSPSCSWNGDKESLLAPSPPSPRPIATPTVHTTPFHEMASSLPTEPETPPQLQCFSLALMQGSLPLPERSSVTDAVALPAATAGSASTSPSDPCSTAFALRCGDVFPYRLENQTRGVYFLQDGSCLQWLPSMCPPFTRRTLPTPTSKEGGAGSQVEVSGAVDHAPFSDSYPVLLSSPSLSSTESLVMYVNPEGCSFMLPVRCPASSSFSKEGSACDEASMAMRSATTASWPFFSGADVEHGKGGFLCIPQVLHEKFRLFLQIWPTPVYEPSCMDPEKAHSQSERDEWWMFEKDNVEKPLRDATSIVTQWAVPLATAPLSQPPEESIVPPSTSFFRIRCEDPHAGSAASFLTTVQGLPSLSSVRDSSSSSATTRRTPLPMVAVRHTLHPYRWRPVSSLEVSLVFYPSCGGSTPLGSAPTALPHAPSPFPPSTDGSSSQCSQGWSTEPSLNAASTQALWRRQSTGYFCAVHGSSSASSLSCFQGFLVPFISHVTVMPANHLIESSELTKEYRTSLEGGAHTTLSDTGMATTLEALSEETVVVLVEFSNYILPYRHHIFAPHPQELSG